MMSAIFHIWMLCMGTQQIDQDLFQQADLVIEAVAEEPFISISSYGNEILYFEFLVTEIHKGPDISNAAVLIGSDVSGPSFDCCRTGARYLMYLQLGSDGRYTPLRNSGAIRNLPGG